MWHHIHNLVHHTTLCMRSGPLYLTSLPLYLCHHTHPIDDITATICMISHPVYLWHHIHYIYDIISTMYDITILYVDDATLGICMTSFALQMKTHPLYHTKPQYLWCHTHFRNENTAPLSDIAPTVSMSLNCLHWRHTHFCMTTHPPSVWHHMDYIKHHNQSLCHHTTVLMTAQPLYVKPHPVWGKHIHLTCDITATICAITPTVYTTSHPVFL